MKLAPAATPIRLAALALAAALSGCTVFSGDGFFSGDKVDYKSAGAKQQPLDVPPDLTQLAKDSRYQPQGGVVSAAAAGAAPAATAGTAVVPSAVAVAVTSQGAARIERQGQQRWLVVPQTPEQLWPQLRAFWQERGFTLAEDNPAIGVMETAWNENRAKLPSDAVRNTLGRLLGTVYDTGERDLYRTRVERSGTGSEIYIAHRGIEEVYTSERKDSTTWRLRPNDPQLEAEFLSRLMLALGPKEEPARPASAATPATPAAAAAVAPDKARIAAANQDTTLVVDDPFDRAWRRVGLALDRSGFTVEDRDRAAGLYFVRYVDPRNAGKEEPGWWARLFGDTSNPQAALRYRVALKGSGDKTTVSVQNASGAAETGENARRIIGLLGVELR